MHPRLKDECPKKLVGCFNLVNSMIDIYNQSTLLDEGSKSNPHGLAELPDAPAVLTDSGP